MKRPAESNTFPYVLEITKILEGALNSDPGKATAYAQQLVEKLQAEGCDRAAAGIRRVLDRNAGVELSAARLDPRLGRVPVDGESRLSLADEARIAPGEGEIVLPPDASQRVEEFLAFVKGADRLFHHGVGIAPSLLIYGPPGCGKTQLARHIASRLGLPLVTARADALISSFLGSTAKNLRALFDHANSRPCVLFLDEFDAVAKIRDDRQELGELKRVVVSLLQNIDSLDSRTVVLAATNHEHLLDPAIWRRFSFKIRLDPPSELGRAAMFRECLNGFADEKTIEVCAQVAEQLTGADIESVCGDAKRRAILDHRTVCSLPDLLRRIASVRLADHGQDIPLEHRLKMTRRLSEKVFSYRRLAEMFGVSLGKVSAILNEEPPNA